MACSKIMPNLQNSPWNAGFANLGRPLHFQGCYNMTEGTKILEKIIFPASEHIMYLN